MFSFQNQLPFCSLNFYHMHCVVKPLLLSVMNLNGAGLHSWIKNSKLYMELSNVSYTVCGFIYWDICQRNLWCFYHWFILCSYYYKLILLKWHAALSTIHEWSGLKVLSSLILIVVKCLAAAVVTYIANDHGGVANHLPCLTF